MKKLYKGKYAICIYDNEDETLIGMYESAEDFAKSMKLKLSSAYDLLGKHFNKKLSNIIRFNKQWATIEFVRM